MKRIRNQKNGFTLVEILIVVIILGILAAIVIPQFTEASDSAKESSLYSNLQSLRAQCELYKFEHDGEYPWHANAGGIATDSIITNLTTATDSDHVAGGDLGPYMVDVPINPFADNESDDAVFDAVAGDGVDWAIVDNQVVAGVEP
ncbi:MAG: prepilin-type N-terminal cleavage/methylation domain-containing protein [Sedimentisphaerales bacterium]|nr:prepilin-type N-terminal cleavage/methylation domain-containing protein [Sedimentisphaerales bacterium]